MQLASLFGVERIIAQSGPPGDGAGSGGPSWIAYTWPPELRDTVRRQWDQAIALWTELAAYGAAQGVTKICPELHAVNLVHNVPTLLHLRRAVGNAIGANFDPSHVMWQGMDIPACVRTLGPAVFHVPVKDVARHRHNQALVGVIDGRPDVDFTDRSWYFCTPGYGHDARWWREFFVALNDVGYEDVVSIENEDPNVPGIAASSGRSHSSGP